MADTTIPTPPQQPADWAMAEAPAAPRSDKKKATKAAPSRKGLPASREIDKLVALYKQRRLAEAQALARSLTLRFPRHAFGWKILGAALLAQGQHAQALLPMQTAAELSPEDAETHRNLGIARKMNGRLAEAEASCRRALEIAPADAKAHNHLGIVLKEQGRFIEAEVHYRRALELTPTYVDGHSNLGSVLQVQGRLTEAEASLRQALALKPDDAGSHSALLFCMSQNEAVDAAALFAEYCRFGAQFEAPLRAQWPQHGNSRQPERCLQVGFVSGDLRKHAVAYFIEPVLAHLAGYAGLSLHAYANHRTDDSVTQRLRGYVKHWHTIAGLSDAALAEKIRADGIDILFDLSNHTGHHRLLSFARKPAPVQISWIGYHGTTGLSSMDYYLTDRFLLPPGQFDHQFTEKLVYLPAWAPFLPSAEAPPVNDLPALGNGYLTFGSFNRPSKISRAVIALWSQLLRAVPDSRMLLGAMREDGQYDTLTAWFAGEGVARERLDFHPHSNMQDYLALHHQVDVCLDTFPYAGGTTTFHALWMGVPTLTLAGSTIAGRTGAGILGHVGLDAFVVPDAAAFVQQGLALQADNFSTLARLRDGLRERFSQSAPGQPALIAASLERALRTMWQRWCAGLPTESFEISMADMTIPPPPQQSAYPAIAPCNALTQPVAAAAPLASKSIAIVSATKLSENDFWSNSALGLSLKRHLKEDARLSVKIAFENSRGLPEIFNNAIDQAEDDAILVFIHDDVWVDEANFSDAVIAGLENFDVIGVAGNRRRVPNQPAWAFIDPQFTWDDKSNLSGRVAHGKDAFGPVSDFGAAPAECELLDGVFLATKKSSLIQNNVRFDAQFDFHFYDMDFCRSARKAGLRLGTWLVRLTHQSGGAFGTQHWKENYQRYLSKWETASENNDVTLSPHEITDKEQELQQAINDALKMAFQQQNSGQLAQAEHIYVEILKIQPKHADANHGLGLMEINLKGALAALPRLEIAVMEKPENEQFWVSYIGALMQSRPTDIVADALELGQKYGLRSETAQALAADFVMKLESKMASRKNLDDTPPLGIYIHQIYYSEQTQNDNDRGFIGLDNLANERPDWSEYWPIRDYLLKNRLNEDGYYGFFSPKFKSKTNLDAAAVHEFVRAHAGEADVFLFSPFFEQGAFYLNIFEQGASAHRGILAAFQDCVAMIAPTVNLETLVMDSRNTVYCNYIVAKPAFWKVWLESCELIFAIAEANKTVLATRLNASTNHAGGVAPNKVFVIERIASLLLSTQQHWKIKAHNPMLRPFTNANLRQYSRDLLLMDALKIASVSQGYPEYLSMFLQIRQSILSSIKKQQIDGDHHCSVA